MKHMTMKQLLLLKQPMKQMKQPTLNRVRVGETGETVRHMTVEQLIARRLDEARDAVRHHSHDLIKALKPSNEEELKWAKEQVRILRSLRSRRGER